MEKNKLRNNSNKRERNSIIVFNAEGRNKTESIYLSNFKTRNTIIRCPSGNSTDPRNMFSELKKYCLEHDINKEYGDKIYLFMDSDLKEEKIEVLKSIKKECEKIGADIILSVPTFEIWFLNHFRYSTKEFKSGDDVLKELKRYIIDYKKGNNYYSLLSDKINYAVTNSNKLEKHHIDSNKDLLSNECNPYSGVHKVISGIEEIREKNRR